MNRLEIKVKDQFEKVYPAIALLKDQLKSPTGAELSLYQRVEKIEVENETILPSTELLFESQKSNRIYRIVGGYQIRSRIKNSVTTLCSHGVVFLYVFYVGNRRGSVVF